ncbi:MAG: hypothetical protein BWK79_13545 [Beggiatoa sp. IS2]|nr:MAG: hypothetical protein BWK79_13545 [Beggiatoa sp. IS2]
MHFAGLSDRGQLRKSNEDGWFVKLEQKSSKVYGLFLVVDGMGGHVAGKLASQLITESLPQFLCQRTTGFENLAPHEATQCLKSALRDFSHNFYYQSQKHIDVAGMGATIVVTLVSGNQAIIGNLGDSRLYLLRGEQLQLLTQDHTIVQYLVDTKVIKPEEARNHPARNRITRYVGMKGEVIPEVRYIRLENRDRLLLCSDGLTTMLSEQEITTLLQVPATQEKICQTLVESANKAGGRDNITALVLDWYE